MHFCQRFARLAAARKCWNSVDYFAAAVVVKAKNFSNHAAPDSASFLEKRA